MSAKHKLLTRDSITLSGKTISYNIRHSLRARRVHLEIKPETGLTVVLPRRYRFEDVIGFLQSKGDWIVKSLEKNSRLRAAFNVTQVKDGDKIPYLGREIDLTVHPSYEPAACLSFEGDRLSLGIGRNGDGIAPLLETWYRSRAATLFETKIREYKTGMGIYYSRLSIRGQRTRWGSCSRKGTVCLNWKLIFVPEPVIDYVIVHELAHIREMNHSPQFWQLVEKHCPDYKKYRKFLRDYPNGTL